jgi:hypothetical protein
VGSFWKKNPPEGVFWWGSVAPSARIRRVSSDSAWKTNPPERYLVGFGCAVGTDSARVVRLRLENEPTGEGILVGFDADNLGGV